jgi:hypothetical protein
MSTSPVKIARGAALEFTEQDLGGPCTEQETFVATSTVLTIAVEGNGDRVAIVFVNQGTTDLIIGTRPDISASQGIRLTANGGGATFTVREDYTLCSRRWYALAISATPTLYVLEINRFTRTLPEVTP